MEREISWELDRQVVLTQLQNVILALRSSSRFGSKSRFLSGGQQMQEHPVLQGALELHNRLLYFHEAPPRYTAGQTSTAIRSGSAAASVSGSHFTAEKDMEADASSSLGSAISTTVWAASLAGERLDAAKPSRPTSRQILTETDILAPFNAICKSSETSETIKSVAVAGYIAMLERPCAFFTVSGIRAVLDSVTGAKTDFAVPGTREVLVARTIQAYVACVRHPAAAELGEESYVRVASRALVSALRLETGPLLKRTAEAAMSSIITALYTRVVSAVPPTVSPAAAAANAAAVASASTPAAALDGTSMMRWIGFLISGEITALDQDGTALPQGSTGAEDGATGAKASVSGSPSAESASGSQRPTGQVAVIDRGPAIQLEGLWLAQAALFTIGRYLDDSRACRLRTAVQNDLSRALLVAGVSTNHVVVLAQILRTVHLAVKCAADHLAPQMLSFLRVLHLNPLAALTEELSRAEANVGAGGGGFFGSGGSSPRNVSRSPHSPLSAASPASFGPSSPTGVPLSTSQMLELYERKEVLLESLAEFCSDPGFLSFCYARFDLSWHHSPVLPQLCDVLVSSAYAGSEDAELLSGGGNGAVSAGNSTTSRAGSESPQGRGSRPLNRLQLVALDAASNMVSEMAVRTLTSQQPAGWPMPRSLPLVGEVIGTPAVASRDSVRTTVDHMIAQKKLLSRFAALFEDSPCKKGIPFLLENAVRVDNAEEEARAARQHHTWLVLQTPTGGREIGRCLFRLSVSLDKRTLSDHIGDLGRERAPKPAVGDMVIVKADGTIVPAKSTVASPTSPDVRADSDACADGDTLVSALEVWSEGRAGDHLIVGTVRFYEEQLKGFIEEFDFKGKPLLTSIREMVYRLCLPGESQKIDRIMEAFAGHWYTQNEENKEVNPFHSNSGAFVLSFAIIMLNTVFHSKRLDRTLSLSDFKSMNRGIDEGNNVPDEYLASIYEDVRRHEVVMAEMMDRGFANDVAWDLEMNGARQRDFHGVDGTLKNALENMCCESSAEAPTPSKPQPQPQLQTQLGQILSPHVFDAVWKRCLLVFTGMTESAGAQVARLSPRGVSLEDAVEHAKSVMPTELSALLSSIRGIKMLARAANAVGVPGAADQCMLSLLPYVNLELANAQDVVDTLYRSLPKLLYAREIFSLLHSTSSSLSDSWPPLADFLLKLYLLGFFAVPQGRRASGDSAAAAALPAVLASNPGIVESEWQPSRKSGAGENGGGWFSSFFGGGGASAEDKSEKNGGGAGGDDAADGISTQPRVRECIPDMQQLQQLFALMKPSARLQLVEALVGKQKQQNRSRQQGAGAALSTANAFVLSYELCFTASVAMQLRGPQQQEPAAEEESSESRASGALLIHLQDTLPLVLETVASHTQSRQPGRAELTPSKSATQRGTGSTAAYWTAIGDRSTGGVLSVVQRALLDECAKGTSVNNHLTNDRLLRDVCDLLRAFVRLPQPLYDSFVVTPLAQCLEAWVTTLATATQGSQSPKAVKLPLLVPLMASAVAPLTKDTPPAAVLALCRACGVIAKSALYDPSQQTESLVDAVLALGIVREQVAPVLRPSGGTLSQPSSTTSRTAGAPKGDEAVERQKQADESATAGEILGLCSHNVLAALHRTEGSMYPDGNEDKRMAELPAWLPLWECCLQRLVGLVLFVGNPRAGNDALLHLQRSLQDTALGVVPAAVIQAIYNDVLFPLVERVCAPGSDACFTTAVDPVPTDSAAAPLPLDDSPTSSRFLSALRRAVAPPPSQPQPQPQQQQQSTQPPEPTPSTEKLSGLSPILPVEVKCRVVNLLPKVLLQYTIALADCPELLQELWQRVLGTLYAVFTAYLVETSSARSSPTKRNAADGGDAQQSPPQLSEEAMQMREAVEETVKNMVFVVAAMSTDEGSLFDRVPYFFTATRNLVRPFSFSAPLLEFLDSVYTGQAEGAEEQPQANS